MNYRREFFFVKSLTIFLFLRMVFFQCSISMAMPDTLGSFIKIEPISITQISFKQDSVFKLLTIDFDELNKQFGTSFYLKIQSKADKNFATRKLYGLFFRKQDLAVAGIVVAKTDATEKFVRFSGKKIGKIFFVKLNAFGQSVYDTTLLPTAWIENRVNKLHIRTANFIIKGNLLFKEGELLNPIDFAESEQLIRNLNYIEDANIVIETLSDTTTVNVKVITKDVWSIGVGFRLNNTHSSRFNLYDKNLAGLGVGLNGYLYYDSKNPSKWGRKAELSVPNMGGSFISSDFWVRDGQGYKTFASSLTRDFYSSKALYGGGVSLVKSEEPYSYRSIDSTCQISYNGYDYWIGRSFRVSRKNFNKASQNLVIATRYISKYFSNRPRVDNDTNYMFQNKEYFLVGLSLNQQNLYKANLIYSFGSTEDIPTGFRVHFTTGIERGEFENRYYLGNEFSAAEVGPWGYLFTSARAGGFITSLNKVEQTTTNIRATYFSNLISVSQFEFRQFLKVDYTRGLSRFNGEGEQIFLDENNGIRGLTSREMRGTSRLVLNMETVAFSPLFIFGFRFAYFAFCDIGFIGSADDYLVGDQSFSGFGLGVRIRNENLVLNTFQLRLGYYPKLPSNADVSYWLITGQQRTTFESFRAKEPQIVPFE